MNAPRTPNAISRRRLLGTLGAGAGALAIGQQQAGAVTPVSQPRSPHAVGHSPQRFGRLFDLPPFAEDTEGVRAALIELGAPGGLLDARDPLEAGPVQIGRQPRLSARTTGTTSSLNKTAGTTFLGQFLDHTSRSTPSPLGAPTEPPAVAQRARRPALDLDSLYGGRPVAIKLYESDRYQVSRRHRGAVFEHLPCRAAPGRRCDRERREPHHRRPAGRISPVPQPRRRHRPGRGPEPTRRTFADAPPVTIIHYQWIVVREFLPQIVGAVVADHILLIAGGRRCRPLSRPRRSCRWSSRASPTGSAQHDPAVVRANLAGDTATGAPAFFGFDLRPGRLSGARPTRSTCAAAPAHGDASSDGRRSSTSAAS